MRKAICLAVISCFLAGFSSCWDKMEEPEPYLEFKNEGVTVSVKGIRDTAIAGGIEILSNTRWAIDKSVLDTIAIPKYSIGTTEGNLVGTGDGILNLTVAENNDKDSNGNFIPRTLEVKLYVHDKYVEPVSIILPIQQEAGAYRIKLEKESENVGRAAGEITVTYDINSLPNELSITTPPEVQRKEGKEKRKVTFSYEANDTGEERQLVIKFRINKNPYPEKEFKIIQGA